VFGLQELLEGLMPRVLHCLHHAVRADRDDAIDGLQVEHLRVERARGVRLNRLHDVADEGAILGAAGLEALGESGLRRPTTVGELLRRPTATWAALAPVLGLPPIGADAAEQIEIDAQYGGYVAVAEARARDAEKMEAVSIPTDTPWETMGLSNEAKAKLSKLRPTSLGQLQRVPGITPAVVQQVAAWLARGRAARVEPG
jgi:tRNA uridine 5-carboxymethylaminomethyl modification enzyme